MSLESLTMILYSWVKSLSGASLILVLRVGLLRLGRSGSVRQHVQLEALGTGVKACSITSTLLYTTAINNSRLRNKYYTFHYTEII